MKTELRNAGPDDADALTDLFVSARRIAMPFLPDLHTYEETRWWMEHIVLKTTDVIVAISAGSPVGFAALRDNHLEHLYVSLEAQGKGVGSQLLQSAKTAAGGTLSLYVFQKNDRARHFYEKHGFHCAALSDGSFNEEGEPDAIYLSDKTWEAKPC